MTAQWTQDQAIADAKFRVLLAGIRRGRVVRPRVDLECEVRVKVLPEAIAARIGYRLPRASMFDLVLPRFDPSVVFLPEGVRAVDVATASTSHRVAIYGMTYRHPRRYERDRRDVLRELAHRLKAAGVAAVTDPEWHGEFVVYAPGVAREIRVAL